MKSPCVRVVQYGFPPTVFAALDLPTEDGTRREVLADSVLSIAQGMEIAEAKLAERGLRAGPWEAIGPCVRDAAVLGADA